MDYQQLYDDLVVHAKHYGIKVELKDSGILNDYAGMNSEAAKKFGFPMPAMRVYIKRSDPIKTKYHTLNHECVEMGLIKQGDTYWEAHLKALREECETDKLPNLKSFKGKLCKKVSVIHKTARKPSVRKVK
jgi:hypothetical protein